MNIVLEASPEVPITVFYCKSKLKDGCPVVAYYGKGKDRRIWDAPGCDQREHHGVWRASMDLGNSKTVAKQAGARCVLIVTAGQIELKNPTERTKQ